MTKEQYSRAVEISNRLAELREVKQEIAGFDNHRLTYSYNSDSNKTFRCCDVYRMRSIGEILDKHDLMIREEIENEIIKLEAAIYAL